MCHCLLSKRDILVGRVVLKKPQLSENVIHFRKHATLELLSDGKDRKFQSTQLNNRQAEFENLALSVEQGGQAMSDVSSFHADSYSHHESVQLSGISQVTAEVVSFVAWKYEMLNLPYVLDISFISLTTNLQLITTVR